MKARYAISTILFLWLLNLGFWGGLIFVAVHFVRKFW
jgi:hypothetical protein